MTNAATEIHADEFPAIKDDLIDALTVKLKEEIELSEFDTDEDELWGTPSVDSKTMIKLSPVVEEYTGKKINPKWLKPGGYETVEEAVGDLVEQLELDFKKVSFSNEF